MGRKSKLTEKQWQEIGERLLKGEKGRSLAKEFGVSEAAIRARFSTQLGKIKDVAQQIVSAEDALKSLPISAQISALNLASELRAVMQHMASAARQSAASTHRLSILANQQLEKVDDVDPLKTADVLKSFAVLTKLANDAAQIPTALLTGSKEAVKRMSEEERPQPKSITVTVVDASEQDADAQ